MPYVDLINTTQTFPNDFHTTQIPKLGYTLCRYSSASNQNHHKLNLMRIILISSFAQFVMDT